MEGRKSILFRIIIACFVCYVIYTAINLAVSITEKEKIAASLDEQIAQQEIENAELKDMTENGVNQEYLERIAREKLGLAYPNERIFVVPED